VTCLSHLIPSIPPNAKPADTVLSARHCAGEQVTDKEPSADTNALASHLQASIEMERSQLTRELHDDLGGLLVGALMDVAWVEARVESQDLQVKLRRARDSLRSAVDLKRNLIEGMRPTLLENVGLFAAMRWHFSKFCDPTVVQCAAKLSGPEPVLNPHVGIAIYRITEEALRLICASLKARSIALGAEVSDSALIVRIEHNGSAMSHERLAGLPEFESMSHRISTLHGKFTIQPADGATLWRICLPIDPQTIDPRD
jgi:signal transduction histidine kinase